MTLFKANDLKRLRRGRKQQGELGRRDVGFSAPKEKGRRREKGLS